MATTFIINPGSTSRKYALYKDGVLILNAYCEIKGAGYCMNIIRNGTKVLEEEMSHVEFAQSVSKVISYIVEQKDVDSVNEITHVGIRVVAPGTYFTKHKVVDALYVQTLKDIQDVAPLHVPVLLDEIQSVNTTLPTAKLYGISDSAFHRTIPEHIRTVSIPKTDTEKYDIQKFGYHGLSFASISRRLRDQFGEVPENTIVCHIGGGISIAALKNGESISTSMGYSPASGMIMGSRGGDLTAGVATALTVFKELKGKKLYEYLYRESGFKGVAGVSDLRLILEKKASCDPDAILAFDMFVHQFRSWIATHAVTLGGIDAVVLTATASVRNPYLRMAVLSNLSLFGIEVDETKNNLLINTEGFIHGQNSRVKIAVMKTDEMGEINNTTISFV